MRWMLSPDWLPEWLDEFSALLWVKRFCLGCFTTNGIALRTSCLFWMNEWRVVDDRTTDMSSYNTIFNMWTVSSDVSIQDIQRRHWQPLFVSLLYPPSPWCEWCDVWRLTTTPGSTSPTLFEQWCGFFYVPQEPDKCKCCETGPTVFRPYPRRLESLTVCRCHYKGSTFFSVT